VGKCPNDVEAHDSNGTDPVLVGHGGGICFLSEVLMLTFPKKFFRLGPCMEESHPSLGKPPKCGGKSDKCRKKKT